MNYSIKHTFDPLYRYDNNKIYIWMTQIIENNNNQIFILTKHGIDGGKLVEHIREVKICKSKDNLIEQAIFNANKSFKDKINKDGYSTNKYSNTNRNDIDDIISDDNLINKSNINKDSIRPMLATKFKFEQLSKIKNKCVSLPCFIQRKYDGLRCIIYKDFDLNKIILMSRTGIKFNNNFPNIESECNHIFNKLNDGQFLFLDGELYSHELHFQNISGLCRLKYVSPAQQTELNKIKFKIYDCFFINNLNIPFHERLKFINKLSTFKLNYIIPVDTYLIDSENLIRKYHKQFCEEGYEGSILRNTNAPYTIRKRSNDLQKLKDFDDDEFEIVGFTQGQGDLEGSIIWICRTKEGKQFNVTPIGTREYTRDLFKNGHKYIGKMLTVIFQGYTEDGIPRIAKAKDIREDY